MQLQNRTKKHKNGDIYLAPIYCRFFLDDNSMTNQGEQSVSNTQNLHLPLQPCYVYWFWLQWRRQYKHDTTVWREWKEHQYIWPYSKMKKKKHNFADIYGIQNLSLQGEKLYNPVQRYWSSCSWVFIQYIGWTGRRTGASMGYVIILPSTVAEHIINWMVSTFKVHEVKIDQLLRLKKAYSVQVFCFWISCLHIWNTSLLRF